MYKKQTQFVCKNLFGENKNVEHKVGMISINKYEKMWQAKRLFLSCSKTKTLAKKKRPDDVEQNDTR